MTPNTQTQHDTHATIGQPHGAATALHQLLNLDLAWRRFKSDNPDHVFVTHPFLLQIIERSTEDWLSTINHDIQAGYTPKDCVTFNVPKPNWHARPGTALDIVDEVVFIALVGALNSLIRARVGPLQGSHDLAYQLHQNPEDVQWISTGFTVWRQWREQSMEQLQRGVQYVLFADVSAFYENIDLNRLRSDISSLNADRNIVDLLLTCLHRWSQPRGKGIPQGRAASHVLAKLYMNPVDQALIHAGFQHLRYVDDIRVFCQTSLEAKQALLKLNELLRIRGLNLQSAKTFILRADEARSKIDGITPVIEAIADRLRTELAAIAEVSEYYSLDDLQRILEAHPDAPPVEVLEQAFEDNFSTATAEFDKSLFHYLLTRLGRAQSRVAVPYCLESFERRPEESEHILRYFATLNLSAEDVTSIVGFLESADAIFDYQRFQVARWQYDNDVASTDLLRLWRRWAFDRNRDLYFRAYCIALLGRDGNEADLEAIEGAYPVATTDLERVAIVCSLTRMEVGRRNSFYGRVRNDGELLRRAVEWSRQTV